MSGSPAVIDTGDIIKIAFDKVMRSPLGSELRAQDVDGTVADIRCLHSLEQACTLNAVPETLGGITYPANTVITIAMRTEARGVAAGATAGLQLNVNVLIARPGARRLSVACDALLYLLLQSIKNCAEVDLGASGRSDSSARVARANRERCGSRVRHRCTRAASCGAGGCPHVRRARVVLGPGSR